MTTQPEPILRLRLTPYPREMTLFTDRAQFTEYLDRYCGCRNPGRCGHDVEPECTGRFVYMTDATEFCVGVFRPSTQAADLVHELAHVVIALFDQIGLTIDHASSEAYTYLIAHLFNECARALAAASIEGPKEAPPCSPSSPAPSVPPSPSSPLLR